jgi:hypothetical protein
MQDSLLLGLLLVLGPMALLGAAYYFILRLAIWLAQFDRIE